MLHVRVELFGDPVGCAQEMTVRLCAVFAGRPNAAHCLAGRYIGLVQRT